MNTTINEFTPAWNVIEAVEKQCSNAFICDELEVNEEGQFIAFIYAAYKDPRALVAKFTKAGGQVIKISAGLNSWYHYTFTVKS